MRLHEHIVLKASLDSTGFCIEGCPTIHVRTDWPTVKEKLYPALMMIGWSPFPNRTINKDLITDWEYRAVAPELEYVGQPGLGPYLAAHRKIFTLIYDLTVLALRNL